MDKKEIIEAFVLWVKESGKYNAYATQAKLCDISPKLIGDRINIVDGSSLTTEAGDIPTKETHPNIDNTTECIVIATDIKQICIRIIIVFFIVDMVC